MDEAAELAELNEMIASPGNGRDSAITASKFNRWLVGEQNRDQGEQMRHQVEDLRNQRAMAQQQHREYGASLKKQSREQMQRDRARQEAVRKQNQQKAQQVKAEVAAQKAAEAAKKAAWIAHGRELAARDREQRKKIHSVVGEGSKRVAQLTAKAKQEEIEFELELKARRQQILEENKKEVRRVKQATADDIIDKSKEYAFEQRKHLASATKAAEARWKEEQSSHTTSHLNKARANKADAEASRAKAKALRDGLASQRQQAAAEMRKVHKANIEAKKAISSNSSGSVKATHDSVYKNKYVPQDAAKRYASSKYAAAIA